MYSIKEIFKMAARKNRVLSTKLFKESEISEIVALAEDNGMNVVHLKDISDHRNFAKLLTESVAKNQNDLFILRNLNRATPDSLKVLVSEVEKSTKISIIAECQEAKVFPIYFKNRFMHC